MAIKNTPIIAYKSVYYFFILMHINYLTITKICDIMLMYLIKKHLAGSIRATNSDTPRNQKDARTSD